MGSASRWCGIARVLRRSRARPAFLRSLTAGPGRLALLRRRSCWSSRVLGRRARSCPRSRSMCAVRRSRCCEDARVRTLSLALLRRRSRYRCSEQGEAAVQGICATGMQGIRRAGHTQAVLRLRRSRPAHRDPSGRSRDTGHEAHVIESPGLVTAAWHWSRANEPPTLVTAARVGTRATVRIPGGARLPRARHSYPGRLGTTPGASQLPRATRNHPGRGTATAGDSELPRAAHN